MKLYLAQTKALVLKLLLTVHTLSTLLHIPNVVWARVNYILTELYIFVIPDMLYFWYQSIWIVLSMGIHRCEYDWRRNVQMGDKCISSFDSRLFFARLTNINSRIILQYMTQFHSHFNHISTWLCMNRWLKINKSNERNWTNNILNSSSATWIMFQSQSLVYWNNLLRRSIFLCYIDNKAIS